MFNNLSAADCVWIAIFVAIFGTLGYVHIEEMRQKAFMKGFRLGRMVSNESRRTSVE